MDKSGKWHLDGTGGKVMVTLLFSTTLQNHPYVCIHFFLHFLIIFVNPKCKLNFPKFAQIGKPCAGCVDTDVYNSNLVFAFLLTCSNNEDQECNPDLLWSDSFKSCLEVSLFLRGGTSFARMDIF